jgi:hypothetical protein
MQSHTCTTSGSLSFRCEFGCWEAARSRSLPCLVHRRSLLVLVSLALIPLATSQTTLSIADWPYKPTRVFSACFVLTRTLFGKLPKRSPIQKRSKLQCHLLDLIFIFDKKTDILTNTTTNWDVLRGHFSNVFIVRVYVLLI